MRRVLVVGLVLVDPEERQVAAGISGGLWKGT